MWYCVNTVPGNDILVPCEIYFKLCSQVTAISSDYQSLISNCIFILLYQYIFIISGYKWFGVQFYGECWSGPEASLTYNRYGPSDSCWEGVGKDWTNMVYKLNEGG